MVKVLKKYIKKKFVVKIRDLYYLVVCMSWTRYLFLTRFNLKIKFLVRIQIGKYWKCSLPVWNMQQNIHCELPELICRQALNFHQNTELSNHINLAKTFYKILAVHPPRMNPKHLQSWTFCIQIQCTLDLVKFLVLFFPTLQFIDERLMKLFYIVFAFFGFP